MKRECYNHHWHDKGFGEREYRGTCKLTDPVNKQKVIYQECCWCEERREISANRPLPPQPVSPRPESYTYDHV